ncbi:MAG: DUF5110 domain-containing protein [Lachnospiraceae bacterium]|nr:DUF5110 domain-containing protein [Lachnospiraceae bacterium]
MEYSPSGDFVDQASQKVFFRDFDACDYRCDRKEGFLFISTDHLEIKYRIGQPFSRDTLKIKLKSEPGSVWHFSDQYDDLGGTVRTLDCVDGPITLGRGLISRRGFAVMDDSDSLLLGDDGWVNVRKEGGIDVYFFGYGYEYRDCIRDFYRLTGAPPMLPAYALGNWWSRYHAYTQDEYLKLMQRFRDEDIPFSVAVVDMDWHLVDVDEPSRIPKCLNGWTGYTWNEELFPDHVGFLSSLHEMNLRTALNLHPADGVRKHECMYPEMAMAAGIDPASGEPVLLDILSKERMADYFDLIHHPYEEEGVDFWWMDWQQGTDYRWIHEPNAPGTYRDPRERLDPLWMLNHLHILDISRNGKRPMFFSRYSGPGSHRYPVGFSGDTYITWNSLRFQPYFTATASNIGYCWWSHDIGGHMGGSCDSQLQVRWLQLGVFSPINRLHSSNSPWLQKESWSYDAATGEIMKKWLRLRYRLFPYIYTMNRRCHSNLEPLIQPMYYSHPMCEQAYRSDNQYWFGSELMAAPITSPDDPVSGLGHAPVWLPDGDWFGFDNGLHYTGLSGRSMEIYRPLDSMPVFAKAGAIVPMMERKEGCNDLGPAEKMEVVVFPGADNTFTLYEDRGEGMDYEDGCFAETEMRLSWGPEAVFTIDPAAGDLSLIPEKRTWKVVFRGFNRNVSVEAFVGGRRVSAPLTRDEATNSGSLELTVPVTSGIRIRITGEELIHDNCDAMDRCFRILSLAQIPYSEKDDIWRVITDPALNVRRKVYRFTGQSPSRRDLEWALREMLTLTEEACNVNRNM